MRKHFRFQKRKIKKQRQWTGVAFFIKHHRFLFVNRRFPKNAFSLTASIPLQNVWSQRQLPHRFLHCPSGYCGLRPRSDRSSLLHCSGPSEVVPRPPVRRIHQPNPKWCPPGMLRWKAYPYCQMLNNLQRYCTNLHKAMKKHVHRSLCRNFHPRW